VRYSMLHLKRANCYCSFGWFCYMIIFVTVPYFTNKQTTAFCEISGFRLGVIETFTFLRFYAA